MIQARSIKAWLRLVSVTVFISSLSALAACAGSATTPAPAPAGPMGITAPDSGRTDPAVLSRISPNLTPPQQIAIYDVMASIPDAYRQNVVHFESDGQVYANRPELIPRGVVYAQIGPGNLYGAADGTTVVMPADTTADDVASSDARDPSVTRCGAGGCTGPLHKRETDIGYSFFQAGITIPCNTSFLHKDANNQNGFVYTGGLSPKGHQLDIGVQFNPPVPDGPPTSVQPFWCEKGQCGIFLGYGDPHLTCDQNLTMAFWFTQKSANAKPLEVLSFTGPTQLTVTRPASYQDWKQVCAGCRVKRVTSLAVCKNCKQTLLGTYFGVQSPLSSSPTPTVVWSNVVQGSFSTYGPSATAAAVPWFETTYIDDPSNGKDTGLVLWNAVDPANESVGINEIGARLQLK